MNLCVDGGFLVGPKSTIPEDPTDFSVPKLPPVGCNQLACGKCGAKVRNIVGRALRKGHDKAQIYEAADLGSHPDVVEDSDSFRLYLCRCSAWSEQFAHSLVNRDFDYLTDPDLPWRCAGHPLLQLPHGLDGARVEDERQLAETIARSLTGWTPEAARRELKEEALWPLQIHGRLAGTELQEVVTRTVAEHLEDPSPVVRAHVLQFFHRVAYPAAARRMLEILEGDRALFAGIPDEVSRNDRGGPPTLEDSLWRALRQVVGQSERARALARTEALTPGKGRRAVFDALSLNDNEWLSEHAAEVVRANPTTYLDLAESAQSNFPRGSTTARLRENILAALNQIKA